MRENRRSPGLLRPALVAVLLAGGALMPATASAQVGPHRTWSLVPLVGFGVLHDNGQWGSAGMEVALELGYGGDAWRWSGYGSIRGLGVGCSEACFEGGPAVAAGIARSVGRLWLGGGVGVMEQFGSWRALPYGRVSLDAASFRIDMRVELPQHSGPGVLVPVLVGMPIPRARR